MKRLIVLPLLSLFMISCGAKSPTLPNSGFSGTILEGVIGEALGSTTAAMLQIGNTSSPVTNAAVTLVTPGGSVPLTYWTSMSMSYQGQTYNSAAYTQSTYAYTPGGTYTLQVAYGGNTYSLSVTAVGNASFLSGSSGVTVSWSGGGSENTASVMGMNGSTYYSHVYGPSISSPYAMPLSDFPGDTTGGLGNYTVSLTAINLSVSATSSLAFTFTATDQEMYIY